MDAMDAIDSKPHPHGSEQPALACLEGWNLRFLPFQARFRPKRDQLQHYFNICLSWV